MVEIGAQVGRRTVALITDMDCPLGRAVGNALEIIEVCDTLCGRGPADLTAMCMELSANMIYLGERAGTIERARRWRRPRSKVARHFASCAKWLRRRAATAYTCAIRRGLA